MKIPERTGKWVEIGRAQDAADEIMMQVPNTIWAAWQVPLYFKDTDLANALRQAGWQCTPPAERKVGAR